MVTIMNIDFIERLKSDVTAIVLQGETEHLFAKDQALAQFYPIFLSILRSRPAWIENLGQQLNPKIHELFNANPALKQQFLDQVDQSAPQDEIEHTLNRSIVPTMNFYRPKQVLRVRKRLAICWKPTPIRFSVHYPFGLALFWQR